jgi:hypothetical protein
MKKTETINICGSGTFPKGNPCYVPNTNIGSFTTNPITYNNPSIGTIIGGLNNPVPGQYVAASNPYIASPFPTFAPPVFHVPVIQPSQNVVVPVNQTLSPPEIALAVNVAQKITPYVLSLTSGEWSLGIHTASFNGRKSKDGDGISNQVKICLEHLRINGGADALRVLTFTECDLTENDMIYFGNTMLQYSLLLKYLDFSDNRISDIGTIYLFNSFIILPTGKYPMHHIINLNLSNNGIGDDGAAHIVAYLKYGHMPATTHVNLADNIITDKGALCFAESFNSSVNKLKVLHLEGNKITKTGEGFLVKALDSISQNLKIVLAEVKSFSKDALKEAIKGMLFVAKNNGISTKETLTNDETIEYCKKGIPNVALNISWGVTKCLKAPAKYLTPKDVTFQDVIVDTMSNIKEVKAVMTFYCITQNTFFSIVDEDFANCLTGVDSMLND